MPALNQDFKKYPKGKRDCEECGEEMILYIKRDFERKRFCSRRCLGLYTGKRMSPDHLAKLLAGANTPEANKLKANKKENHPKWIADRSLVKVKRTIAELRWWRKAVFERDNYTCQDCGQRGGRLNADHIKPYQLFKKIRHEISNGRTLCEECHKKTPTYGASLIKQKQIYS